MAPLKVVDGEKVYNYLHPDINTFDWHSWNLNLDHIPLQNRPILSALISELHNKKITFSSLPDKLRWGHHPSSCFNLQEA
jgi:hypothetical protein